VRRSAPAVHPTRNISTSPVPRSARITGHDAVAHPISLRRDQRHAQCREGAGRSGTETPWASRLARGRSARVSWHQRNRAPRKSTPGTGIVPGAQGRWPRARLPGNPWPRASRNSPVSREPPCRRSGGRGRGVVHHQHVPGAWPDGDADLLVQHSPPAAPINVFAGSSLPPETPVPA